MPSVQQDPSLYVELRRGTPLHALVASVEQLLAIEEADMRLNHVTVLDGPLVTHTIGDADTGRTVLFVSGGFVSVHYAVNDDVTNQKTLWLKAGTLVVIHLPANRVRIDLHYVMLHNEPIVVVMRNVSRHVTLKQALDDYRSPRQPRLPRLFGCVFSSRRHPNADDVQANERQTVSVC